ncbi:Hsp20/alpha crystallin family protein [Noviherbaspirillum sp. 1P10PC]|uniref:Hsp20/alpha crystallin family protein n=1 Tax=Noviherbaspirillum sp. 1P10PC TaxID=3132292 RepID=UPI00399F024C
MSDKNSVTKQDRQVPQEKQDRREDRRDIAMTPPVDVVEDASAITLLADLPGVSKDKLSVQFETDSLTIEGEVFLETPEGMESSHAEVRLPRYRRVFSLSKELDTENTSAEFRNGVLKLRIPKAAHVQPRRIEVRAA